MQALKELNATWVCGKAAGAEILISTWPPSLPRAEADGDCRQSKPDDVCRLITYQDGRLVGFVCAVLYCRGDGSGEVVGYGLNMIRFLTNLSPLLISDFTVATLIQSFQTKGKAEYLACGHARRRSPMVRRSLHWARLAGRTSTTSSMPPGLAACTTPSTSTLR